VFFAYFRHCPPPSHCPSARHEFGKPESGAHSSSGAVSARTLPHVPFVPLPFFAAEQAWHAPVQAALQHTPSTQKPLAQEPLPPHVWPFVKRHCPELHVHPAAQSVSTVQLVLHPVPTQAYPVPQFTVLLAAQVLAPLHVLAEFSDVPDAHDADRHTAPEG